MSSSSNAPATRKRAKTKQAPATLIEKDQAQEAEETPQKRKQARRDLEGMVGKLLKDNFWHWSPQQVDCTLVNGASLRQQLLIDKALRLKGEVKMGKNYYQTMRARYEDSMAPRKSCR